MPAIKNMTCEQYLNATKDLHGGWGYDEFHAASNGPIMLDGVELKLTQQQIADKMNSVRQTIGDWQEWDRTGVRPGKKAKEDK